MRKQPSFFAPGPSEEGRLFSQASSVMAVWVVLAAYEITFLIEVNLKIVIYYERKTPNR